MKFGTDARMLLGHSPRPVVRSHGSVKARLIGVVHFVQVACSLARAVPGSGEAQGVHLSQAHLLPPLQAVVLGKLR